MITLWHVLVELAEFVEVGHQCEQFVRDGDQCCEIATHEQAWPGSTYRRICDRHLVKMLHLAGVFGFVLPVRAIGVWRRADEPEDLTAARFAAMELT